MAGQAGGMRETKPDKSNSDLADDIWQMNQHAYHDFDHGSQEQLALKHFYRLLDADRKRSSVRTDAITSWMQSVLSDAMKPCTQIKREYEVDCRGSKSWTWCCIHGHAKDPRGIPHDTDIVKTFHACWTKKCIFDNNFLTWLQKGVFNIYIYLYIYYF